MRAPMRLAAAAAMLGVAVGSHQQPGGAQSAAGIQLSPLGVYETGLFDDGAIEIAAYDPLSRRAFLTFAAQPRIDVVYLSDPHRIIAVTPIDLTPWGLEAHATSVAV